MPMRNRNLKPINVLTLITLIKLKLKNLVIINKKDYLRNRLLILLYNI